MKETKTAPAPGPLHAEVERYWNERIHDMEMTSHPVGSPGFFSDLEEYRFDKLRYLPQAVDFDGYAGKAVLEVGCGLGIDLARFAAGGARVTGIDLSTTAIGLAKTLFEQRGLDGRLEVMSGHAMEFSDESFDLVYVHGVIPYAAEPEGLVRECHRVLRTGGEAIFMCYNRRSWLSAVSKLTKVGLEHDDAPVFRPMSAGEFRKVLAPFGKVKLRGERFPVKSRLHGGWKGLAYNGVFVPLFRILPKPLVRRWGWHWMAYARK